MRAPLSLTASALLMATLLPQATLAGPAVRFSDHTVSLSCEQAIDGGLAATHVDVSDFGDFAGSEVWLDPALPFDDPATLSGGTDTVSLTVLASGFELAATFPVFDVDGNEVGQGSIQATLTPDGPIEELGGGRFGNENRIVSGTFQPLAVTGTLSLPTIGELALDGCGGAEQTVRVVETDPRAFVLSNEGVEVSCFWETDGGFAGLFAISDSFGPFADAFLDTPEQQLFLSGESSLELTPESLSLTVPLEDFVTGDSAEATAEATLSPIGDPSTFVILTARSREKVADQLLAASGALTFSTGQVFDIDDTSCFAHAFDSHLIGTAPAGPKPGGKAPVNDTPEGALPLSVGSTVSTQTGGAAIEPELVPATCEEAERDKMGRTVWYTIEGTGGEITVDTAGSNFDTVLAVYVLDGEQLIEIACVDDVFLDPIGVTFQAAISGPTDEGVTYYIQIGGFDARDRGGDVEFGRLRVSVS